MPRPNGRPVILIELMRFACALTVMAYHYGVAFWHLPGVHPAQLLAGMRYVSPVETRLQFGWLGVEIFFVISGLVIARSALGIPALAFVRHRVLRLAPAAWICATITLAAIGGVGGFDHALWACWTRAIVFWPASTPIDGSYWTLGVELAFYLAVATCLSAGDGARRIEHLAIGIGVTSLLFWIGCAMAGEIGATLMDSRVAELLLLKHGCFFALGVLIASCQANGLTPLRASAIAAVLAGGALEIAVHSIQMANDTGLPRATGAALALFAGAAALLAGAERAQAWLARWLRPEAARALGKATYPLYLLHQDAGAASVALLVSHGVEPGAALVATAAVMLALAMLVAGTVEPSLRRWLAGLLGPRRGPAGGSLRTASPPLG